MSEYRQHFRRTFEVMQLLQLEAAFFEGIANSKNNFSVTLDQFIASTEIKKTLKQRLQEIHAIENEKLTLVNSGKAIKVILQKEISYCQDRDSFLLKEFAQLLKLNFIISPYVHLYESHWKWIVRETNIEFLSLPDILKEEPGDYFFVLQQTGSYDEPSHSNILEFPLTEYQYFLLSQFEEPKTVAEVMDIFSMEFDCQSASERAQLTVLTEQLIRELIFRLFIVIDES